MLRSTLACIVAGPLFLWGCADAPSVTEPVVPNVSLSQGAPVNSTHTVQLLDKCDPLSFNAAIGAGTCLSTHPGLNFDKFIAQLVHGQSAPAWRNAPSAITLPFGGTLVALNRGGEVHTFTQVAQFGGGIVPLLNGLAGTPNVAPECASAPSSEFLPPGGTDTETITQHGTLYFQCCIHPWMRTVVYVP